MSCLRSCSVVVLILSAVACGGSSKSTPTPASAPAAEPAVETKAEPKPGDLGPKPIAQEESATESSEPECKKDKDCTIFADCCTCKAVLAAGKPPVPCDAVCGESKCEVKGKTIDDVACVSGHCKLKK
jgi:hypothetical protein